MHLWQMHRSVFIYPLILCHGILGLVVLMVGEMRILGSVSQWRWIVGPVDHIINQIG